MQTFNNYKNIILSKVNLFAIIYISFSLLDLRYKHNNYIKLALFLLWLIFAILQNRSIKFLKNKRIYLIVAFIIFVFLTGAVSGGIVQNIGITFATLLTYSPIIIFSFYLYKKDYNALYLITLISFIVLIICSISSSYLFNIDKNMPVKLAQNSTDYGIIAIGEIYGLVNALSLISSFLFILLLSKKLMYSYQSIFTILLLILFFIAIYTSRSSLTVLITLFGYLLTIICVSWYTRKNRALGKIIIVISGITLILITFIFAKEYIGQAIMYISKSKSSKLLSRVYSVGESMLGIVSKNSQSGFLSRFDLITTSIKTFVSNPLFGINYLSGGNYYNLVNLGVGDHSQWFDMLAMYGLIGSFPIFYLLISNFKVYFKHSNICPYWIFIIFLLGLINPYISFTTIYAQFLFIPSLYFYTNTLKFEHFD